METPTTPSAWANLWLETQQKYLEAWAGLPGQGPATAEGWAQAFRRGQDAWWRAVSAGIPGEAREGADRLFDLSRGYWQMGESFRRLVESTQTVMGGGGDWPKAIQEGIKQFGESLCGPGSQENPWAGLATFCGMPLDNWRRVVSSLSVLPGDLEKAFRQEGPPGPDTLRRVVARLLAAPPLGYTREWQEQLQEWADLWLEHGQAMQEYQAELGKVTTGALDRLGARLLARAREGKPLESLREAYDLWVDCGEEAYAEVASGPAFISAQARLTNTLMAVKRHEQQLMAEVQSGLNMPTRRELDTSHKRVHELRRELRGLEGRIGDLDLPGLHRELEALRAEVRALRTAPRGDTGASPPAEAGGVAPRRRARAKNAREGG